MIVVAANEAIELQKLLTYYKEQRTDIESMTGVEFKSERLEFWNNLITETEDKIKRMELT